MKYLVISVFFLFAVSPVGFSQEVKPADTTTKTAPRKPRPKPSLLRGPYLQAATSSSIVIRWRTDVLSRSLVSYGTSPQNRKSVKGDSALVTEHQVKLSELSPGTTYYYSIGDFRDTLQGDSNNYFRTLPVPGSQGAYRIGIFGDCGVNTVLQGKVRDQFMNYIGNKNMDAWILLGDNAYDDGTDLQYQRGFFNSYQNDLLKKYPLFPSPGNHDYHDYEFSSASAKKTHNIPYYKIFTMPVDGEAGGVASKTPAFYAFDIGNVHFLSLDSYGEEDNVTRIYDTLGAQVQWVKKDLEANKNKQWVVVFFHHPPYTMGSHNSDRENELIRIRENFIRILERYGVDLVLCGHSHNYERSRLMKGYYGPEAAFDSAKYNLSQSSGMYNGKPGSCPYIKYSENNQGTVYVVSGAAASVGLRKQENYPHNAMPYSNNTHGGASILEVNGNRLDMKWINDDGEIRDQFTMMKDVGKTTRVKVKRGELVTLTASFNGSYKWSHGKQTTKSIQVKAGRGPSIYTVSDSNNCLQDKFELIYK